MLTRVGLARRLTHRPGELSGGEQQRVALARALLLRPRLLLADEPTGNLDMKTGREMHALFFELNRELGMTILIVTHNNELAEQTPRRLQMVDGVIVEDAVRGVLAERKRMSPAPNAFVLANSAALAFGRRGARVRRDRRRLRPVARRGRRAPADDEPDEEGRSRRRGPRRRLGDRRSRSRSCSSAATARSRTTPSR